ncbi:MAG TPA: BON domain-containing protein [Pyrinomonadaceae bacterium]|jgi:hyperosmotically inducible protein|nr:BON domain-containing protein [Pyrinomonadaceae bacterium]
MRTRSIITTVLTLLLIAGAAYYFYGYRHRDISSDFNAAKEYTEDAATTSAVKSALALNKQLSSFDIHVDSIDSPGKSGNDVTLTGHVPTADDKRVAEEVARATKGVGNVVNNLEVDSQSQSANEEKQFVPDLEIKAAVLQSLLNNPGLKSQEIKVDVNNGEVKLSGSVGSSAQKAAAESAARAITNVRDVDSNSLAVTTSGEGQP